MGLLSSEHPITLVKLQLNVNKDESAINKKITLQVKSESHINEVIEEIVDQGNVVTVIG